MEEKDVALKILHTADWHLGRRFPSFSDEDETSLTRARFEAVDRVLGLAETFAVDAVLCAGDLFDDPAPSQACWEEVLRMIERRRLCKCPVFLLPGNHDPLEPNSVWSADHSFRKKLPAWVQVVDRDGYEFNLSDEAVLYANPCRSQAGADDLALRLPARQPDDRRIRIGLVHGQTFDIEGHQTNFPIALDAAQKRGLNYLAIGDTHAFRELPPKTCPIVYPGAPEATSFGEKETGFAALVFFPHHGRPPVIQKQPVSRWQWRDVACRSVQELELLAQQDLRNCVLRLSLNMSVSFGELDRIEKILGELKGNEAAHGKAGMLQEDRKGLEIQAPQVSDFGAALPEALQSVVARLQTQANAPERDGVVARRALYRLYQTVRGAHR
jgi:3',5'-cyclic AMP phosphodiesterase CpdA